MSGLVIGLIVVAVLVLYGIITYNGLIKRRNQVDNAWSQIDVQLQRRHDLIPNLVETVKGYVKHEEGVFQQVTEARSRAINASTVPEQAQAENMITGALKSLFAVAEAYPELRANENFLGLQEELSATEGRISYARQFFNDSVQSYNTKIQTFPTNIFAGLMNFEERQYFDADDATTGPVQVQF